MRTLKTLLMLGAAVAGGLYLASPRARDARKRLRGAYEILTHAAASTAPHVGVDAPRAEPSTSLDAEFTPSQISAAAEVALHVEHALEHGADGRARSAKQSRRPNALTHGVRHS